MKTKEKIIKACEELAIYKGRGFYHLSMEELAREAGVSKRTIYRYFAGKEELFEAALIQTMDQIVGKNLELFDSGKNIRELVPELLKNIAYAINQQVLSDLSTYYPFLWQRVDQLRQDKINMLIHHILTNTHIRMRWRVDQKIFKASLLAAMSAVVTPSFVMESGMSFEEVVRNFLDMFLFGALEPIQEE
ncbi:MAG: putative HTH-type transcriptional regulator [Candidatus Dichloromethanomonas elyunquensis]|nr:MAG: putative HTH-type transcriptional regulator [Candidatus Dichloromethanomonas elyunquensis]